MTWIIALLQAAGAAVTAADKGWQAYQWLRVYIRENFGDKKADQVRQFLLELGGLSEAEIRKHVLKWNPPKPLTAPQREEFITALVNLSQAARFHTTNGTPMPRHHFARRLGVVGLSGVSRWTRSNSPRRSRSPNCCQRILSKK